MKNISKSSLKSITQRNTEANRNLNKLPVKENDNDLFDGDYNLFDNDIEEKQELVKRGTRSRPSKSSTQTVHSTTMFEKTKM